MLTQQSPGSKLGIVAGLVIVIAFFLPWVRSCNVELSGYNLATNSTGLVEEAWMYWITLLTGLLCIVLFFLVNTTVAGNRIKSAVIRLIAGLIGFLPLLNIWYNTKLKGGAMEILYGGWLVASGYLGIFISFFLDLGKVSEKRKEREIPKRRTHRRMR